MKWLGGRESTTSGGDVIYFLGNVPSHLSHAKPLHDLIGGVFVVLSEAARQVCEKQGVPAICLDDRPDLSLQFDESEISKTIDFINLHARVVIFYEVFEISKAIRTFQVMLTHGNSFKDYYIPWRQKILPCYKYIASLGPDWEDRMLRAGVEDEQLLKVGIARADRIIQNAGYVQGHRRFARKLGLDPGKKIVAYMPTWWGPSSVNDTGKILLRHVSESYSFIFRPHPSTPPELVNEYLSIIENEKLNAVYVPDGLYRGVDLNHIYEAASVFIGDMSSVMLDALLTDKPLIFAYGGSDRAQKKEVYDPLGDLYRASIELDTKNASQINELLKKSFTTKVGESARLAAKEKVFYGLDGTSTHTIAKTINELRAVSI